MGRGGGDTPGFEEGEPAEEVRKPKNQVEIHVRHRKWRGKELLGRQVF